MPDPDLAALPPQKILMTRNRVGKTVHNYSLSTEAAEKIRERPFKFQGSAQNMLYGDALKSP